MFRKKKSLLTDNGQPVPRGRTPSGARADVEREPGGNPLARRFQVDSEPPTMDLAAPARFQASQHGSDDPKTSLLQTDTTQFARFISHKPGTGKFYIHPGPEGLMVTLQGEPVVAPTELRRGDVIRLGDAEFQFRAVS